MAKDMFGRQEFIEVYLTTFVKLDIEEVFPQLAVFKSKTSHSQFFQLLLFVMLQVNLEADLVANC